MSRLFEARHLFVSVMIHLAIIGAVAGLIKMMPVPQKWMPLAVSVSWAPSVAQSEPEYIEKHEEKHVRPEIPEPIRQQKPQPLIEQSRKPDVSPLVAETKIEKIIAEPLVSAIAPVETVQPEPVSVPVSPPAPVPFAPAPIVPVIEARFDANYLNNPAPVYPRLSLRLHEEGRVLLQVKVAAEGHVMDLFVKQSSGHQRLDEAARKAVSRWRFIPARRGDETIISNVVVPVVFRLQDVRLGTTGLSENNNKPVFV